MKNVYLFSGGNTVVTDEKEQIPELQESWLLLYVKFLESKGENPLEFTYHLPTMNNVEVFKTSEGDYNWRKK
ncbi:MAG: hypothetical protein KKD77_23950 [Gammaproteobacteria bacterium]|nr:hypothetical protein [Gammaproteobacteria bacterium]